MLRINLDVIDVDNWEYVDDCIPYGYEDLVNIQTTVGEYYGETDVHVTIRSINIKDGIMPNYDEAKTEFERLTAHLRG